MRVLYICLALSWHAVAEKKIVEDIERVQLSKERMVFELADWGTIEMAFYPEVAPITVRHIIEVARLGGYTSNHFFRVDKGFVAQTADVLAGRDLPVSDKNRAVFGKHIPGEFSNLPHKKGVLSMARFSDPNSGTTSFSILLGNAPHLDGQYAVFGRVVEGMDILDKLQTLETKKEGIFVMPLKRVTISNSYVYLAEDGIPAVEPEGGEGAAGGSQMEAHMHQLSDKLTRKCPCASHVRSLFDDSMKQMQDHMREKDRQIEALRKKCLPG